MTSVDFNGAKHFLFHSPSRSQRPATGQDRPPRNQSPPAQTRGRASRLRGSSGLKVRPGSLGSELGGHIGAGRSCVLRYAGAAITYHVPAGAAAKIHLYYQFLPPTVEPQACARDDGVRWRSKNSRLPCRRLRRPTGRLREETGSRGSGSADCRLAAACSIGSTSSILRRNIDGARHGGFANDKVSETHVGEERGCSARSRRYRR